MPRSFALLPLANMELPRMEIPMKAVGSRRTPSPPVRPLLAMVFPSPALTPPTLLKAEPPPEKLIPLPPLPSAPVPLALVPMRLPRLHCCCHC